MDDQKIRYLKQLHSYESWKGRNVLDENLFIWKFFLSGNEFPGWKAHRIQPVDSPPSIQSIWERPDNRKDQLLSVDIFECESRIAAHDFLILLLGEFMSPLVQRREEIKIGDLAFSGPEDTMLLFSRANLVVSMGNAGSYLVPVKEIASQFDSYLSSKPKPTDLKVIFENAPADFIETDLPGEIKVRLAFGPYESSKSKRWNKFFSKTGEVFLKGSQLTYHSTSAGPHELRAFSIDPFYRTTIQ